MKKLALLLILSGCFIGQVCLAQFKPLSPRQPVKKSPVKTQTSPGLISTPTKPAGTTPPAAAVDYYLCDVKVTIGTGADNKEALSNVAVEFWVRDRNYKVFAQNNLTSELPVNSTVPISLEQSPTFTSGQVKSVPIQYLTQPAGSKPVKYSDIQAHGIAVRIIYKPNLFLDAWKIQTVSVSFNFRDKDGNLQPGEGSKSISFPNAANFMDCVDKRMLLCTADGNLNPNIPFVTNDISRLW